MYTENGKAIGHGEREGVRTFPFSSNTEATCNIAHPKHKDKIAPEHTPASSTDLSPIEYGTSNRHRRENSRAWTGLILTRTSQESENVCLFARKVIFVRMLIV